MKKLFVTLLVVGALATGFAAGRFTAAPPVFTPTADGGADAPAAAFDDFIRAQRETVALYRASPFFDSPQERAEAYRGYLYAMIGAIKATVLQSRDHPRFMRGVDWTSKSGLDNPDNNYYVAMIRDDAEYRISGRRGTTANLIFQLLVGQPGVAGAGSSTNVSVLYDRDLLVDAQGNFEIIVSRDNPGPGVNWLPNGDGAETLLVRYTHSDWVNERDSTLFIEKLGAQGSHDAPLTAQGMSRSLRAAAVNLYDRTGTWLAYAERAWTLMPRNGISAARATQGGLVGQYSAFGSWEFTPDQALVLSTAPAGGTYQGIQLGSLWFVSLDYETRTSSLTLDQMHCSADGRCYAVVAHKDPGIQNWLDTGGHTRGLLFMRWQGLTARLPHRTPA